MRKYLVDLTNQLIAKNHFEIITRDRSNFIEHVSATLEYGDVGKMNPETLGKIMASFEIGDVLISKEKLLLSLHFCGDCKELLREQVALFLAYVIRDRLFPTELTANIPPYQRRNVKFRR